MKTARRCKRRGHKVFRKDLLPLIPVHSLQDLHIYQPGEKTRDLARRLECSELAAAVLDSRVPEEAQCRELLNSPGLRAQLDALDMGRAAAAARAVDDRCARQKSFCLRRLRRGRRFLHRAGA